MDELKARFVELEAQLERHAGKAKCLHDQGLVELAEREGQRWKVVSEEYVRVGNVMQDLLSASAKAQLDPSNPAPGYTWNEWQDYCKKRGSVC